VDKIFHNISSLVFLKVDSEMQFFLPVLLKVDSEMQFFLLVFLKVDSEM